MKKFMNVIFTLSLLVFPGCKWFSCTCTHDGHDHHHQQQPVAEEKPSTQPVTLEKPSTEPVSVPTPPPVAVPATNQVVKITTTQEFEEKVIAATKPVLVDFSAKWCGPCQVMKPIVEQLAQEMGSKYIFVEVNVDEASEIANKYGIKGIPTFTFFKDGKEVIKQNDRLTGAMDKNTLKAALEKILG